MLHRIFHPVLHELFQDTHMGEICCAHTTAVLLVLLIVLSPFCFCCLVKIVGFGRKVAYDTGAKREQGV